MSFLDIFKSKSRKATERANALAAFYFQKGYIPVNLGTEFQQKISREFRKFTNTDLTASQYIALQLNDAIRHAGINTVPGGYSVVIDFQGLTSQVHLKACADLSDATMQAAEFMARSPRDVHAMSVTQHPMPGRVNIEVICELDWLCTIMLCPVSEA
ncbi:hypothetical protein ACVOZ6_003450 [Escherichia coli]